MARAQHLHLRAVLLHLPQQTLVGGGRDGDAVQRVDIELLLELLAEALDHVR